MAKASTGARLAQFGLAADLLERYADFRAAYLDATESKIVAEALELFMKQELDRNQSIRERYEAARRRRNRTT